MRCMHEPAEPRLDVSMRSCASTASSVSSMSHHACSPLHTHSMHIAAAALAAGRWAQSAQIDV